MSVVERQKPPQFFTLEMLVSLGISFAFSYTNQRIDKVILKRRHL